MSKKKKILVVTGIRSEYDILLPVMNAINDDPDFELRLVVTGAHLSDWHGDSMKTIHEDGFIIAEKIDYLLMTNRTTQRPKGIGNLISSLTQTVEREKPDFIVFLGDREESIACAIVANYMNILSVHIGGGDTVYGNADDPIRFACSELSHIHFTTSEQYKNNLLALGEESKRVFNVGNPIYSSIAKEPVIGKKKLSKLLDFELGDYLVVLQHPLSSESDQCLSQMESLLESVIKFLEDHNMKAVGIYPNTDPGSYDILSVIDKNKSDLIKFYKNLPRDLFINLMRNAKALVGNSSMGILEGPFYKLPVINVGDRQMGRLNAGNVEFVDFTHKNITRAIKRAVFDNKYIDEVKNLINPFGVGNTEKLILSELKKIDVNDKSWHVKKKYFD